MRVDIRLAHPISRANATELPSVLIDTGASWTTLPRRLADALELDILGQITGRTVEGVQRLDQSFVYIEIPANDRRGVTPVLISDTLDEVLIGVLTLEALALAVDPLDNRLTETELLLL